ncbi:MAG TPA: nuclear transport factor 2 family protein [Kofleriaceae bacterium]|nr:nuclear transport factor 2 family protein [Kofleriaceae bacterium]
MNAEQRARAYIAALDAHDGAACAALFAPDGSFEDPETGGPVAAAAIAELVQHVSAALSPRYTIRALAVSGAIATIEWRIAGTHTAPLRPGLAATGRAFELDGVDVLELGADGIRAVRRYFDRQQLGERIGLQVIVEPIEQDGAQFGYSMHVASGNRNLPRVIALTWISARDEAEKDRIRGHSRQVIRDFRATEGFIGIVTGFAHLRGFTVTAWDSEEALANGIARHHATAKQAFHSSDLSPGVWTSVWSPVRTNRIWTRCPSCTAPNDVNDDHRACTRCGAPLPERPTFW